MQEIVINASNRLTHHGLGVCPLDISPQDWIDMVEIPALLFLLPLAAWDYFEARKAEMEGN